MFGHDSFFFIGVFIFIFIFWLVIGGPAHTISFTGPLLANPTVKSDGTQLSLPQTNSVNTGGGSKVPQTPGIGSGGTKKPVDLTPAQIKVLTDKALRTATFGAPSPYRTSVTLSHSVIGAASPTAGKEYLQFSVSSRASGPITISGWKLQSEATGNTALIPKGTEVPRSGVINASESIVLYPGDRAIISSGRSPIGASFRENKCMGYFSQFQTFLPALPNACPVPKDELQTYYGPNLIRDVACIQYVDNLHRCKLALSPPTALTGACQNFVTTHLNYNGCIADHQNGSDFKGTTWRIYLGRDSSMWRTKYESIRFLDAEGKTIDLFSY